MKLGIVTARTEPRRVIRPGSWLGAFLAFVIGLAVLSVSAATPAFAAGAQLFSETFQNNTVPTSEVVLPNLPSGAAQAPPSQACLTAGGTPSGASAVPQCPGASDPNGSGLLRFTDTGNAEEGGVFSATSVPATQGLDITFDSYQFGGSGADGIAFALAIANPAAPQPPADIGNSGGSLGYAPYVGGGANGLSLGYLGVGIDAYGNFSTTQPDGTDCAGQGDPGNGVLTPQSVAVRGPGNGQNGYCLIGAPTTDGSATLDGGSPVSVPVEVAINPTGSSFTTASGLVVPAADYAAQWTPVGGTQQTMTGALPNLDAAQYADLGIPTSYYNSSGIPYQMTFGWVASTGGLTDTHEIRDVVVSNGTGSSPTFGLTASDNKSGVFGQGTSVGYTFTPSMSGANESGTVTFADPFPAGLTPTSTAGTDVSWTCSIASATVTCTHAGVSSPATMPSIHIVASVASNASTAPGALNDRGYVSANDALDADALDQGTAYGPATVTSLSPNTGPSTGGTHVAVTGTNFNNVSSVNVGSATVSATCTGSPPFSDCYTLNSTTSITLYTPSGAAAGGVGAQNVTVTNDAGTGSGSTYTYTKAPSTTTVSPSVNPSVSGQAASFTANLTPGATGSVTFAITPSHGSAVACTGGDTVVVSASAATCSIPSDSLLAVGSTYAVTANYSGDANYLTSTGSLSPPQTVNPAPTTTSTPTSTVNPSVYGQSVTYSTTVSSNAPGAGIPTGSALFSETVRGITTGMCIGTLDGSGDASCTSSTLPPAGIASVKASYLGDSNYLASTSSGLVQFVDQASTTTVLSSNLNPSGYGKPVAFTATVSPGPPGGGTPVGQVAFSVDGSQITGCSNVSLDGSGQATCTTSSLSVAGHTVVAAYGGNANYLSSSGSLTQTVGQEVTSTSETSSVNPSVTGQGVAITAHVLFSGSGTPTGTVTFTMTPTSGPAPQCSGGNSIALGASNSAVCNLVLTAAGAPYHVQAEYNGDSNFDASGSASLNQVVTGASTTTSVSTSVPNAVTDQTIVFTATVSAVSPGSGAPNDGTVAFDIHGSPVTNCGTQAVTAGTATCTVSNLDVAGGPAYSVTAFYGGAPDYASSNNSGSPLIQTIGPDATTTSLSSSTNPSTYGQNVNFTATVTANAPGGGTPTGTVTISVDGSTLCTGLLGEGQFTCSSSTLTAGTHQLSATYAASTDYGSSISPTLAQGVNQAATTTTVTSSHNPSPLGETVTITATVAPVAPGQGTPTGLVDFSNGIIPICVNVPLSEGLATCTIDYPIGTYTIVAAYRGSAGFAQSSGQTTQVVQMASTTTTVIGAPTVVTGQGATYQVMVAVDPPGSTQSANLTGTVSLYAVDTQNDPQIALCSTNVGESGATVSCSSFAAVAAGSPWSITAVYSGDTNFTTSTSAPVTQTVNPASTATSISSVVNPSVTGQNITATAGFTILDPGTDAAVAPTGNVEFDISVDGGITFNPVSGCESQPTSWNVTTHAGSATCTLPSPPAVSSVELIAVYSGDLNFASSTSPPTTQVVNQASTTTAISIDTNPSVTGETVNYTSTVTITPPGTDTTAPTGTVDFQYSNDGGNTWNDITGCSVQTLAWNSEIHTGTAACATSFAETSSGVMVQAVYSGDGNFAGSISAIPVIQDVNAAQTTTSVVLAPVSSVSGEGVTATATLLITAPGSDANGAPTGTVDFQYSTNGGDTWNDISACATQELGWDSIGHTGTSSCTTAFDAGSSPVLVQAVYSGDPNFSLSTSPSATETVTMAGTTTSLVATPDHSVSGQAVSLGATVSISGPGSDSPAGPSGSVEFDYSTNGGANWNPVAGCATENLGWDSIGHTGSASCTTAFAETSSGVMLRAVYLGDTNFTTSTSAPVTQTVNTAATAMALGTSTNPSVNGQRVTFGVTVTVNSPGGDAPTGPTGSVTFESSTNHGATWQQATGCLTDALAWTHAAHHGNAQCTVQFVMSQSGIQFRAHYSGDSNFGASGSNTVTQTIGKGLTSTAVSSSPNSSAPRQPVTFTAKISVIAPGLGTMSGTVLFTDGVSTLCAGVNLNNAGSASCASRIPITATQSVVARYSGNAELAGSSGSVNQSVTHGYRLLGADGGVFSFGNAQFYGSLPQIGFSPAGSGRPHELNAPLVGISSTLDGKGYWLVASDGGVFTFGDAVFHGSTGAMRLNKPIVAMAITPDGKGYWLVASDGGVFAFGDAVFHGSTGAMRLNKPIVAMAITPDGKGYWLVASDGGVFAFGTARYVGSPSTGRAIAQPVVGLAATFDGGGYWLVTAGGQVYSFGNAVRVTGGTTPDAAVVGMAGSADGKGYWMVTARGGIYTYGDTRYDGSTSAMGLQRPIVGMSGL